jgi:hypothetical protein
VVADFITDHTVGLNNDACMVEVTPWKLFFDGSVCSKGWVCHGFPSWYAIRVVC